jgi:8-oxo-dGTP pyrophosphatase MutT (NUDIX family)
VGSREALERPAARVMLVDPSGRVLLLRTRNVGDSGAAFPWLWLTPGGGLLPGETWEAAAGREVAEETGLGRLDLGPCVWHRRHRWSQDGRRVESVERFFLARVPGFPARLPVGSAEAETVAECRWWSADEIDDATSETFVPRRMGVLLRSLLRTGPRAPIDVGT